MKRVGVLAVGLIAVALASLVVGSTHIPLARVLAFLMGDQGGQDGAAVVLATIRVPRTLTAMLAGAALGVAGLQMQTLFRNPLADPFALTPNNVPVGVGAAAPRCTHIS